MQQFDSLEAPHCDLRVARERCAAELGFDRCVVVGEVSERDLRYIKIGACVRYRRSDVDRFVDRGASDAALVNAALSK